jgi:serine protease
MTFSEYAAANEDRLLTENYGVDSRILFFTTFQIFTRKSRAEDDESTNPRSKELTKAHSFPSYSPSSLRRTDTTLSMRNLVVVLLVLGAQASTFRGTIDKFNVGAESLSEQTIKRYVARYSDLVGRRLVQRCAKTILMDTDETDYTIFEGDRRCFSMLWRDNSILDIEEDYPVFALTEFKKEHPRQIVSRSLGEHIPWGIIAIQADLVPPGPHDVTVCVVDSGIAAGHPDFQLENIGGSDRAQDGLRWDKDRGGHGSHIAGIISAVSNNDLGVQGVGTFKMFIARALDDKNTGSESYLWMAVEKCIQAGADVINLSLGSRSITAKAAEVYSKAADEHGIILVAAAGNSGDNSTFYPANHPSTIAVGATYDTGERIPSSVTTTQLELQGPGYSVLSTGIATSAIHTSDFSYPAKQVEGTPRQAVTGKLVYCSVGGACDAQGRAVCLVDKGDEGNTGVSDRMALEVCTNGGGAGAVFFDSSRSDGIQSLEIEDGDIPAISIRRDSGLELVQTLHNDGAIEVTIGDGGDDDIEYTYTWGTGSSVASAHVAAGAALLKSHFYSCNSDQIRYVLAYTAKRHSTNVLCDDEYGYGVIQVKDAYDWLLQQGDCNSWTVTTISKGGCTTLGGGIIKFKR